MRTPSLPVRLALAIAALFAAPGAAQAAASDWADNEHARVRLVAAADSVAGETLHLGLQAEMADGWKIYWRSPGDAGSPPRVGWRESANRESAERRWPVPHRFQLFGLQTFGYKDSVILPIAAKAGDPDEPVKLRANVDYLVCADTCVPHQAELALTLPPGEGAPSEHAHAIDRYRARVPGLGAETGLTLSDAKLTRTGEEPRLTVAVRAQPPLQSPDAVVEGLKAVEFGPPEVALHDGGERAVLRLPGERVGDGEGLAGKQVTLTVFDGNRGLEREITLERGELPAHGTDPRLAQRVAQVRREFDLEETISADEMESLLDAALDEALGDDLDGAAATLSERVTTPCEERVPRRTSHETDHESACLLHERDRSASPTPADD